MEIDPAWLETTATKALMVALSSVAIYASVILYTRLSGLRSFSKMSAFDFTMTIAVGSLIASTLVLETPSLLEGMLGVGMLFLLQFVVAWLRPRFAWVGQLVDNDPLLLMLDGEILHENLRKARITEEDLRAKLREANAHAFRQVRAVVLETTGDISVLHGDRDEMEIDPEVMAGVTGVERLRDRRDG